ncbi:MAG: beta-glucosidase [Bauldia sp.]|nr:beta-glucosidase [Bauldia sp.]
MLGLRRSDFGPGFIFGAATAAYQIEGGQTDGRGPSIWDSFASTPGNVLGGDTGAVACDHYHRWPEDLDLVRDGGFDAYRFSFAWPRLLPDGTGTPNGKGLAFYDRLIDGMLERGIKPFATLYHWDLPSPLQDRGGWANRDVAAWFADYAALVARHFGDRLWGLATINEPWCVAFLSHYLGKHAPGLRDIRATARAMHHVLLAHGTGLAALREAGVKNLGIVLNLEKAEPASAAAEDALAAGLWDGVFNRWFLGGVLKARYPADIVERFGTNLPDRWEDDLELIGRPLDWCGINYYTRALMKHAPEAGALPFARVDGPLETTESGWEIYPEGLLSLLQRVWDEYPRVPLYITENGMADVPGVDDPRRTRFYADHLEAVRQARQAGVDIRGYFAWSLLDNFEWAEGYAKRFGLVEVDFASQKRTPRASYRAFQAMLTDR